MANLVSPILISIFSKRTKREKKNKRTKIPIIMAKQKAKHARTEVVVKTFGAVADVLSCQQLQ